MQYLAAYTLATLSGNEPSTSIIKSAEQTLTAILSATGKPVDAAQVKAVVESLKGKQVHDLISKGQSKVGSSGAGAAPAKAGKDDKKKEEKKEEKKPEPPKKEEKKPEPEPEEEDFNLDLFG